MDKGEKQFQQRQGNSQSTDDFHHCSNLLLFLVFSINGMPICHVIFASAIQLWVLGIVMFLVKSELYKVLYLYKRIAKASYKNHSESLALHDGFSIISPTSA